MWKDTLLKPNITQRIYSFLLEISDIENKFQLHFTLPGWLLSRPEFKKMIRRVDLVRDYDAVSELYHCLWHLHSGTISQSQNSFLYHNYNTKSQELRPVVHEPSLYVFTSCLLTIYHQHSSFIFIKSRRLSTVLECKRKCHTHIFKHVERNIQVSCIEGQNILVHQMPYFMS